MYNIIPNDRIFNDIFEFHSLIGKNNEFKNIYIVLFI